ncbi:uncharacterized protein P884DRAFT_269963 [Thermothelomyces heterothallicus CBS 202.75]|uniref:uncharacterized protein n=1 Tax=Thermothelomyces heterothallicus CBS 202.75 TaxID=1149848 RepID=UPI0037421B46
MAAVPIYSEIKRIYSSLQKAVGIHRRKRQLQISEPFNFRKEAVTLPGLSEEKISALREKAAVSCLGIAHAGAYNDQIAHYGHPRSPSLRSLPNPSTGTSYLSIPLPNPIPGGSNDIDDTFRRGLGRSSGRSSSTARAVPMPGGPMRISITMNDLSDLLLFENHSEVWF